MARITEERAQSNLPAGIATVGGMVLGAALIALGARVTVPMDPVPMTLQTLALLAVGGLGGGRVGLGAAGIYLLGVLFGAPILANGAAAGGASFLELKSAGYVVAFLPAAVLASRAGGGVFGSLAWMALAHIAILILGTAWLAKHIGLGSAIEHGLRPFLWGALVKSLVAAALVQHFAERRKR